jgi:hypothetical protein
MRTPEYHSQTKMIITALFKMMKHMMALAVEPNVLSAEVFALFLLALLLFCEVILLGPGWMGGSPGRLRLR